MQTRMLAMLAMIGLAGGAVLAQTPSFNPILATYGNCYVFRPDGSYIWHTETPFPLTGSMPYIMERSATLAAPNGGHSAQYGLMDNQMLRVAVSVTTWGRASNNSVIWVRFTPNVSVVDCRIEGAFSAVNYMDTNTARLVDRTLVTAPVNEQNFTKDQTVRVTLNPTHEYELYVAVNHNNIYQGPSVSANQLSASLTLTPAQNWLNGTLNLAQVASPTASDRMVGWQLLQGGSTLASGVFPSMGSQQFRLGVPLSATGPAHVVFDTDTFLRRVVPVTLGAAEINLDPVTLLNGDVDGSHEVDLTDIDLVIAKYLESGWALPEDVDLSGEVDLTDIDIVISNYLAASDPLP